MNKENENALITHIDSFASSRGLQVGVIRGVQYESVDFYAGISIEIKTPIVRYRDDFHPFFQEWHDLLMKDLPQLAENFHYGPNMDIFTA